MDVDPGLVSTVFAFLQAAGCATLGVFLYESTLAQGTETNLFLVTTWIVAALISWGLATRAARPYEARTIMDGRHPGPAALIMVSLGCAYACVANYFSSSFDHSLPSLVLNAAGFAILWVLVTRAICYGTLGALLRRGFCIDQCPMLADTVPNSRLISAKLTRWTRGRLRSVGSVPLPGMPDGVYFAWINNMVTTYRVDRIMMADNDTPSGMSRDQAWQLVDAEADVTLLSPRGKPQRLSLAASEFQRATDPLPPLSRWQAVAKRSIDVAIALAALIVTAPALALISLVIKLDSPGPVFFRQKRQGLNGVHFDMWKFRTMYQHMTDHTASIQTRPGDVRVTRVGRLLRKTSLDELPQVLNVLLGNMSIVGPRPHALGMTVAGKSMHDIVQTYELRHRVKPGITGWAQVNGSRGQLTAERELRRRVALDCYYIDNWSLKLDALIVTRTLALVIRDRNAF
jgi:exopolysaccharide biosynthesis polyprenyl glycosylphosphotransferase